MPQVNIHSFLFSIFIFFILIFIYFLNVGQCRFWKETFTVKGTLYIPYAELKEPFYAWYDGKNGQSRIDYYGGMVKTYQLSGVTKYGTSLKVAPVTTEQELNSYKCLQVNGSIEAKIEPQTVLPSLVGFECIGELFFFSFVLHLIGMSSIVRF